jgi:hypothetical protein
MLFPIVLERHLQLFAIPIQLQAFEKLWTNLDELTTKGTRKKLAHIGFDVDGQRPGVMLRSRERRWVDVPRGKTGKRAGKI